MYLNQLYMAPMQAVGTPRVPSIAALFHSLTGCKFSRAHTLLSLALVEVQNQGRVGCCQKNVWAAGGAITMTCA